MAESTDVLFVNARGQPLVQKTEAATHTTNGPFQPMTLRSSLLTTADTIKGARRNPRFHDWHLYLRMYKQHAVVNAAINKKIMVATNTGFEFVPRSSRLKEVPEAQANVVVPFFDQQPGFLVELRSIYLDLELFGDAFFYCTKDRLGRWKRFKRLQPWTVHIKANKNGDVIKYIQSDGKTSVSFEPEEIIHFRHINPEDDLYGLSRLEAIKSVVTADMLAEAFNTNFFRNGAATGTLFIIKNATEKELEYTRNWIREEYVSSENAFKPVILAGDVSIEKSVASHQDMGFLEGRRENKKQILAVLDVPPAKIGDMESANRSNSKEQDKSFRTESVMPLQNIVEDGISNFIRDVLGQPDVYFKHSESDKRDAQEQMELWEKAARMGFMSVNEVRATMGKPAVEGGDIHYVMTPTGAVPLVDLELYFKLAAPNTDDIPPEMHAGHEHVDEAHGEVGPVPNSSETDNARVRQKPNTTKFYVESAAQLLAKSTDETTLRHSFAYLHDATCSDDSPLLQEAAGCLRKALTTDDEILKPTYIERAKVCMYQYRGAHIHE